LGNLWQLQEEYYKVWIKQDNSDVAKSYISTFNCSQSVLNMTVRHISQHHLFHIQSNWFELENDKLDQWIKLVSFMFNWSYKVHWTSIRQFKPKSQHHLFYVQAHDYIVKYHHSDRFSVHAHKRVLEYDPMAIT